MDRRLKNRFDVQVVLPDCAFGIKHRTDVTLTPEDVATTRDLRTCGSSCSSRNARR